METNRKQIEKKGYSIINNVYTENDIATIVSAIDNTDPSDKALRKTNDLFAIRRFLHKIPAVTPLLLTDTLQSLITILFGNDYSIVKSIYFDKPAQSNWFVAYHQNLTISVQTKTEIPSLGHGR